MSCVLRSAIGVLPLLVACLPGKGAPDPAVTSTSSGSQTDATSVEPPPTSSTTATGGTTAPGTASSGSSSGSVEGSTSTGDDCAETDPSPSPCDPWQQDCPEGQKCTFYAPPEADWMSATRCVDVVDAPANPGEPCSVDCAFFSGRDDCAEGSYCWSLDLDTQEGYCVAICAGHGSDPVCTDPQTTCYYLSGSGPGALCLENCHPLDIPCAHGDDLCVPAVYPPRFVCVPDYFSDNGEAHAPCPFIEACANGYLCAPSESSPGCDPNVPGCCLPYCDLTMNPDPRCDADLGETCLPFYDVDEPTPPGYENLGVCSCDQC